MSVGISGMAQDTPWEYEVYYENTDLNPAILISKIIPTWIHVGPFCLDKKAQVPPLIHEWFDFSIYVLFGSPGLRLGCSLGEFADFILGWAGVDIARDDWDSMIQDIDDPYDFGAIAAANALSDIYAMGGEVLFAINLVAFPDNLGSDILHEILRGGAEKIAEAGAVVVGGHSVNDKEPKYGLAVTGIIDPQKVLVC